MKHRLDEIKSHYKNKSDELIVKSYPKNIQAVIQQQPIFKLPNCLSCKQNIWLEFIEGYYCRNCEKNIMKQRHQIDKKVLGQHPSFQLE